jgi:hypothetical protein
VVAAAAKSLTIVALDVQTGAERWRRLLQGSDGYGFGRALVIDRGANLVVGGQLRNRGTCYDIAVTRLSAATARCSVRTPWTDARRHPSATWCATSVHRAAHRVPVSTRTRSPR